MSQMEFSDLKKSFKSAIQTQRDPTCLSYCVLNKQEEKKSILL